MALLKYDMEWRSTVFPVNRLDGLYVSSILLFSGYPGSFPGINRPRCNCDLSLLSNIEVKNERSYTSASPISLHGVDRDNFTFT